MSLTTENAESTKDALSEIGREATAAGDAILKKTARFTPEHLQWVEVVKLHLAGKGWQTARAVCEALGIGDDRYVRKVAEVSNGEIISGNFGYRLTCEATPVEINEAEARLLSQARQMKARAVAIRCAMNRRVDCTAKDSEGAKELLISERGGLCSRALRSERF